MKSNLPENHDDKPSPGQLMQALAKLIGIQITEALVSPELSKIAKESDEFKRWLESKIQAHVAGSDYGDLPEDLAAINAATKAGTAPQRERKLWSVHSHPSLGFPVVYMVTENVGGDFSPVVVMSAGERAMIDAEYMAEQEAEAPTETKHSVTPLPPTELPPHNQPIGSN